MVLIGVSSSSDSAMFSAAVSASNSEKCWKTMPMPSFFAMLGLAILTGLAVPADLAGIGFERAEQHLDQRRLAGAVLAEQRVDLALADCQIDIVAGLQRAEYLRQATNLQQARAIRPQGLSPQCPLFCFQFVLFPDSIVGATVP